MKKETNCGLHEVLNAPIDVELLVFLQPKPLGVTKVHMVVYLHYGEELNIKICNINILCVSNFAAAAASHI